MAQAKEERFNILGGPSKWDLIILSLGQGQKVTFQLEYGLSSSVTFLARVTIVAREDGSNESWILNGSGKTAIGDRTYFRAHYHTKQRQGTMFIKSNPETSLILGKIGS